MTELNSVKVYSSTKKLQVLFHLLYVYAETKMRKKEGTEMLEILLFWWLFDFDIHMVDDLLRCMYLLKLMN